MRITSATSIEARPFQYNLTPQAAAESAVDSGSGIRAKALNGLLGRTWNDVGGGHNAASRPFFERFLEDQHRGGCPKPPQMTTMAYPSDSDHDGGGRPPNHPGKPPQLTTMAYPSDSDHDSCPIGPKPPGISTLRYPSDSDGDIGGKPPFHGGKPPHLTTMAYPSDSDHDSCPIGPKPPVISTLRYPSDSDHDLGGIRPT
ncbi:MAG: hypothetical protein AB7S38_37280 [Vulcanimicrobiota bacterium]